MFKLNRLDVGMTPPIEYKPVTAGETYAIGETLKLASGKVTKCTGTTAPEFICAGDAKDGELPCYRVHRFQEFTTVFGVAPAEGVTIGIGDKVTLHTDGLSITSTKTGGVATVVDLETTAAVGVAALVRF